MSGILPQHVYLRLHISGSQSVTLDRRYLRSLRVTNSLLSGAGDGTIDCYVAHGQTWPYGLRAMDEVALDAVVTRLPAVPTEDQWQRIYTGVLTDVPVAEAVESGLHVPLQLATNWHLLEVSTESPDQFTMRYQQSGMQVGDFLLAMARYGGFPSLVIEAGADINTGLISLAAVDQDGFAVNPQYQSYATVMASVAKMAGRELYANEDGLLEYRPSHYAHDSAGPIPTERLVSVSASVDTDAGLINRVQVRYGLQESQFVSGNAPALGQEIAVAGGGSYDRAHYRDRLLIVPAPYLLRQADADWLAQWVLSWGMSNTRPAVVTVNFWPEARVGTVYTLEWPRGTRTDYYCSSVVHQVQVGGPALTILGLTYGRAPGFQWNIPQPPADFGLAGPDTTPTPPLQVTGTAWQTTYYTPADQGQPALPTYQDNPDLGPNLRTAYGALYWRDGWAGGQGEPVQDYSIRPCAFDPAYTIPELGNVTLSAGDRLRLASGQVVECRDVGGAVTGRHLDVFYWTAPNPAPPTSQNVQYLRVKHATTTLPDIPGQATDGAQETPGGTPGLPPILGPMTGETGDSQLANTASGVAGTLLLSGGYYHDAPAITTFGAFCKNEGYALPNGDGDAQCVLFVRFCLLHMGYPAPRFGEGKDAGDALRGAGYLDVSYRVPAPGDVVYFDAVGSGATPGSNTSLANGAGHVAIITAVTLPDKNNNGGSVTVAQANATQQTQQWPLLVEGHAYVLGSVPGFGPWLGTVRPRHQG